MFNPRSECKEWCLTVNNPTDEDSWPDKDLFIYYVIGKEGTQEGCTPHFQCYVMLKKALRLSAVSKLFPRAHCERMYSTSSAAAQYCKKEGDFVEFGALPLARNVLGGAATKEKYKRTWEAASEGRWDDIDCEHKVKHYRTLKQIEADCQLRPKDLDDCSANLWIWGPTRTGKSYYARSLCDSDDLYVKNANKWWCNYAGESTVLIDDLGEDSKLQNYIKTWADRYAFRGEAKGSSSMLRPQRIIITSNYQICELFNDTDARAIEQRFTVKHLAIKTF